MLIYLIALCLFAYTFSVTFPALYLKEKRNAIEQGEQLLQEQSEPGRFPVLAIAMFIMPVAVFSLSASMLLSTFCFILAVVAYTDISTRWIPDPAIYALLAVSMFSLHNVDLILPLWSVVFYLIPAVMISACGYIRKKETWIASGDYYVFPSVGLMVLPEYAAGLMLINLSIVVILSRWVQKVPLVTVAYFTFLGYQLCLFSGLL